MRNEYLYNPDLTPEEDERARRIALTRDKRMLVLLHDLRQLYAEGKLSSRLRAQERAYNELRDDIQARRVATETCIAGECDVFAEQISTMEYELNLKGMTLLEELCQSPHVGDDQRILAETAMRDMEALIAMEE